MSIKILIKETKSEGVYLLDLSKMFQEKEISLGACHYKVLKPLV